MSDDASGSGDATSADADGATDDVTREAETGPICDPAKKPSEDPCVVDDLYGVFVSVSVDAGNDGTKASPFHSIAQALANTRGKNVYVCAGTYPENLVLDATSDGARIFGGFDCATWAYSASQRPRVKPTAGVPLTAENLTAGATMEDIELDAPATSAPGEISIAAFIFSSNNVSLTRVKLVAADAQPGQDAPAATSNYNPQLAQDDRSIAGHDATGAVGGTTQTCDDLCTVAPSVASQGGKGGDGAPGADAGAPSAGGDGLPTITPPAPAFANGKGGDPEMGPACTNGTKGSNAPSSPGGAGASTPGTLSSTGWTPTNGAPGTTGGPGQGGGGGGGGLSSTKGGGGGGACGGCGGTGGNAGKGGGSSFALLSFESTRVTLSACELVAGAGGKGGDGAEGQTGQAGGTGGVAASGGCPGGNGGQGAQGGGGGGGAGGLSVAIGYSGTAPTKDTTTTLQVALTPAPGGALGPGGSPAATKGLDGVAQDSLELPSP